MNSRPDYGENPPAEFLAQRTRKVRAKIFGPGQDINIDGFVTFHLPNVRYLTGFTGTSGAVFVTADKQVFITDSRYTEQAKRTVAPAGFDVVETRGPGEVASIAAGLGVKTAGFESAHTTVERFGRMETEFGKADISLVQTLELIESVRIVKDGFELEKLRCAFDLLERAYPSAVELIRPGRAEQAVAWEIEKTLRSFGSEPLPFEIILASGERSAMPHGVASEKVIQAGDAVVLDWGAKSAGYSSDNTRNFSMRGGKESRHAEIFDVVLEANRRGIEAVRPGVSVKDIDRAAREYIESKGFGRNFGHGTGHGVGLEIHEAPSVSPKGETVAVPGMVFTIEPGIYIPGELGVRVEDMIVVTETGCEVLSERIPKDLKIM